jgi:hypothetical protein
MSTPTLCPICKKDDAIRKVSSVVTGGVTSGVFSGPSGGVISVEDKRGFVGGYTTLGGTTVSALARRLLPPPKPEESNKGFLLFLKVFAVFGMLTSCVVPEFYRVPRQWALLVWLFAFALSVLLLLGAIAGSREERARVARETLVWKKQIQKWSRLYYCFRDDIVFDPLTGETCRPESLTEFLRSAS